MQTIYVEKEISEHGRTVEIISRYKQARVIEIDRYSELFNPKAQNFRVQKQNPALILAAKHSNHVLQAPPDYNIGGQHNYYFSHMMNCIYDCRYCFLQGMYSSANYVVFINFDNFFDAIKSQTQNHTEPSWYFSGYDCDSLALEPVTHFTKECLDFFADTPRANLELRTKSTQIRHLLNREPIENCVVAYSLSPDAVAKAVEHKAPSVAKRIQALSALQQAGWKVGLRFDPLLRADNFKTLYGELFKDVFDSLDVNKIHSVSVGPFRLPKPFFKKLIQLYPEESMFADSFDLSGQLVSYSDEQEEDMIGWSSAEILKYISKEQFFPCV